MEHGGSKSETALVTCFQRVDQRLPPALREEFINPMTLYLELRRRHLVNSRKKVEIVVDGQFTEESERLGKVTDVPAGLVVEATV